MNRPSARPARLIAPTLALASCLALGAAACGGGSSASPALPAGTPTEVLTAAASATNAAGTALGNLSVTVDVSGLPGRGSQHLAITGSAAFDLGSRAARMTLELPRGRILRLVVVGGQAYLNTAGLGLSGAKPWIELPAGGPASGIDPTQLAQSAFSGTKLLSQLQGVTAVGTALVKGAATTHYRGTLDLAKALAALGPSGGLGQLGVLGPAVRQGLADLVVPVDVWIDGHDRLRRFSTTLDLAPLFRALFQALGTGATGSRGVNAIPAGLQATVGLDSTYYGFGQKVSISAPPPDEVGPAPRGFKVPGGGMLS